VRDKKLVIELKKPPKAIGQVAEGVSEARVGLEPG